MRLLDLFSGEGGAGAGYIAAGFDVTGVDVKSLGQFYPGTFVQSEALSYLSKHGHKFDVVHASPPCQGYSRATAGNPSARANHVRLIAATRSLLRDIGVPYVIENVEQAKSQMVDPVMLCGRMFGLKADDEDGASLVLDRHRLFESNMALQVPQHYPHDDSLVAGVYGGSRRAKLPKGTPLDVCAPLDRYAAKHVRKGGYCPRSIRVQQELLGIDWMSEKGMRESIPPIYAEIIGAQLFRMVG